MWLNFEHSLKLSRMHNLTTSGSCKKISKRPHIKILEHRVVNVKAICLNKKQSFIRNNFKLNKSDTTCAKFETSACCIWLDFVTFHKLKSNTITDISKHHISFQSLYTSKPFSKIIDLYHIQNLYILLSPINALKCCKNTCVTYILKHVC